MFNVADPPSAGLAEWLGISLGLEKGERLFLDIFKNSLSLFSIRTQSFLNYLIHSVAIADALQKR